MNAFRLNVAVVLIALGMGLAQAGVSGAQPPPPGNDDAPEVLTRGPVHEAYAAPISTGSVTLMVVPKPPPDPVEEVPPDVKPEEDGAIWISGYWAWDDDRKDFLWVSGVWRVPPLGYSWVAGYWAEADGAWRWVPGFWTSVETQQVAYYSEPPESIEQGPTSDPPSAEHFWVPGCWLWRETRYVWRPGYWSPAYVGWVWVPASYCWSPRGWIFVDGYWDYPFRRRGLLFAPVYFTRPVWRVAHYSYAPSVVVDVGVLTVHLFARPHYCHYYFGDYYAPAYDRLGFYPWFAIHRHRHYHYDPIFTYYRWYNRDRHPQWEEHLRGWHRYFREHEDMRPPRTLVQQHELRRRIEGRGDVDRTTITNIVNNITLAAPLGELRQRPDARVRLTELAPEQRRQVLDLSRELRDVRSQRRQLELAAAKVADAKPAKPGKPESAKAAGPRGPERVALPRVPDPRRIQTALREPPESKRPRVAGPGDGPSAKPALPGKLEIPGKLKVPTRPETPGKPEIPARPEVPGKLKLPARPEVPGKLKVPTKPEVPARPSISEKPEAPGKPKVPARPEAPGKFKAPASPEIPGRFKAPTKPEPPASASVSEKPGAAAPGKAARVSGKPLTPIPSPKASRDGDEFQPGVPPRLPGGPKEPAGGTRPERRGKPDRSGKPDRP